MSRIRTVQQLTSKTTAVTVNAYDSIVQTVALSDSADGSFVFTVNNDVVQDIATVLVSAEYPAVNGTTTRTATLTGTSGTANVTINGVDYLATFNTNLTTTASDWVTANATALLALGFTVTSSGAIITVSALTTVFPTIAVTNVTLTLGGTLGTQTNTASTGNVFANIASQDRGVFVVRVQNVGTSALNTFARIHFKVTHN